MTLVYQRYSGKPYDHLIRAVRACISNNGVCPYCGETVQAIRHYQHTILKCKECGYSVKGE
jgi:ribosomal protein L37AE/L43A